MEWSNSKVTLRQSAHVTLESCFQRFYVLGQQSYNNFLDMIVTFNKSKKLVSKPSTPFQSEGVSHASRYSAPARMDSNPRSSTMSTNLNETDSSRSNSLDPFREATNTVGKWVQSDDH